MRVSGSRAQRIAKTGNLARFFIKWKFDFIKWKFDFTFYTIQKESKKGDMTQ
jgi:hypothetical protein